MDTDSKYKSSFHKGLFSYLIVFFLIFILGLIIFLYNREKMMSQKEMNNLLQMVNTQVYIAYNYNESIDSLLVNNKSLKEITSLRVTIIDTTGKVLYDSDPTVNIDSMQNHSSRHEFIKAMNNNQGYTVRRKSVTTSKPYFYSATKNEDVVVRSAVEYSISFIGLLRNDENILWFICIFAIIISFIAFGMIRNFRLNIKKLQLFAKSTATGQSINTDNWKFSNDELGEITNQMITLYKELEHAQKALILEHQRAESKEQEQVLRKKQLTQNINHELKTPVSSIQGYLETIIEHEDLPRAKMISFIEKSYKQCLRLSQLLQDLSIITRMDEGKEMISKEPICLSDIVDDSVNDLHPAIIERGFKVNNSIPPNLMIKGNQTLLSSIFNNLINNALAYSEGHTIFVYLLKEDHNKYTICFSDDGVGIPKEHQNRLFERFYRIDKGRSRQQGGTGLGLSIVKNAVAMHGGDIFVRNRAQGGAEFIFSLEKDI